MKLTCGLWSCLYEIKFLNECSYVRAVIFSFLQSESKSSTVTRGKWSNSCPIAYFEVTVR